MRHEKIQFKTTTRTTDTWYRISNNNNKKQPQQKQQQQQQDQHQHQHHQHQHQQDCVPIKSVVERE